MGRRRRATPLEARLGFTFRNPALLLEALTHASYAHEHKEAGPNNERLEFLGDGVVNLLAAKLVYEGFAAEPEGELSARRARVVSREGLAQLAREIDLGAHLRVGEGQRAAGGASQNLLADAYEALVGAVFLDGGFEAAQRCFGPAMTRAIDSAGAAIDFKTQLQEACHRLDLPAPRYVVASTEGPAHARHYHCAVSVGEEIKSEGKGASKKAAEQACAQAALAMLASRART
ncbi:MAG: ribonuclease III [Deltaproteobacteria bacterium]|nr:ribonuclease III [Deltaproteobacteria bacterium]